MTLRRVLSCFIWVTLLVSARTAEAKGRSAALQEALDHATVIAIGQMESLDLRGERRLVTLRVEHVARGELPDVITFDAEPPPGKRLSREFSRVLVFLEPTSQQRPGFRLALGGAASLRVVSRPAEDWALVVADASWAHLCGPHSTKSGCHTRLDRFLRDAGLRPFKPRREATFRVYQPTQCGPCELEGYVKERIAPDSRDCGFTAEWEPDPRVLQCMRESSTAHVPFHMRMQRQGIDSQIVDAYVSDGTQVLECHGLTPERYNSSGYLVKMCNIMDPFSCMSFIYRSAYQPPRS